MLDRHVVAVAHHDIAHRKTDRPHEPFVCGEKHFRGDFALGDFDCILYDIGAENRIHQRLTAAMRRKRGEFPESAVEKRKCGDRMVARSHRKNAPFSLRLKNAFLNNKNTRMI